MKLFKLNDNKYVFLDGKAQIEGDDIDIIAAMLLVGVDMSEILVGLSALEQDDMADYGINKTFIISKKLKQSA